jgi:hypothetical protein
MALFVPLSVLMLETSGGTKMTNDRYLAQLFDEDGDPVNYDNQVIDASNDQDTISKAGEWAASHRLGMVAMLIVKQGFRGVHSRKVYLGA